MMSLCRLTVLASAACLILSGPVLGQSAEMLMIDNPFFDERGGGEFGRSVAIAGDQVLVGAPLARDEEGVETGLAYLFDGATGDLVHVLEGEAPGPIGLIGFSVAAANGLSLVGGYGDDPAGVFESFAGAAYVFDNATGDRLHKFTNPVDDGSTNFGNAVALSDTHALIGAPKSGAAGQAFLFDVESGAHLQTFAMPDDSSDAGFGDAVAVADRLAVISASLDGQVGAVFVFDTTSGDLLRTIPNPTPAGYDNFGEEIALAGENLLIGACGDDDYPGGAAYLFDVQTGEQLRVFVHPEGAEGFTCFGEGISLDGDHAVVSAYFGGGQGSGPFKAEVLIFALGTGELVERHTLINQAAEGSPYEVSTALASDRLAIAISMDDRQGSRAGSAYVLPIPSQ